MAEEDDDAPGISFEEWKNTLSQQSISEHFGDSAKLNSIQKKIENGEKLFKDGHVKNFTVENGAVRAKVQGTETYEVKIEFGDPGEIKSSFCSCEDGKRTSGKCKHVAAVVICSIHTSAPSQKRKANSEEKPKPGNGDGGGEETKESEEGTDHQAFPPKFGVIPRVPRQLPNFLCKAPAEKASAKRKQKDSPDGAEKKPKAKRPKKNDDDFVVDDDDELDEKEVMVLDDDDDKKPRKPRAKKASGGKKKGHDHSDDDVMIVEEDERPHKAAKGRAGAKRITEEEDSPLDLTEDDIRARLLAHKPASHATEKKHTDRARKDTSEETLSKPTKDEIRARLASDKPSTRDSEEKGNKHAREEPDAHGQSAAQSTSQPKKRINVEDWLGGSGAGSSASTRAKDRAVKLSPQKKVHEDQEDDEEPPVEPVEKPAPTRSRFNMSLSSQTEGSSQTGSLGEKPKKKKVDLFAKYGC